VPVQEEAPTLRPATHFAGSQVVAAPGRLQSVRLLPSQRPWQSPVPPQAARPGCGAPSMATQTPGESAASQASHWPVQAEPQHTPSTQKSDAHSTVPPQAWPAGFLGVQTPAEQKLPAMHWASVVQVPRQAVAPQMNSPQGWVTLGGQAPWPVQAAATVAMPALQAGARQAAVG
jgi:hypothetical protein